MARDDESAVTGVTPEAVESTEISTEVTEAGSAEATENQATEAAPQSGAEGTEVKAEEAKPEGPSKEEIEAATKAFEEVVNAAVESRDKATGELSVDEITKVKTVYAALPATSAKTKARNALEEGMRNALAKDLDAPKARAYMLLGQEVKSTGSRETVAKAPVDPTEEHVNKVTAMYLASSLVEVGEGVAEDWVVKVQELGNSLAPEVQAYKKYLADFAAWEANTAEDKGDAPKEPEVNQVVLNAAKIAHGRGMTRPRKASTGGTSAKASSGPSYSGPRRNVKEHIRQVFASKPVGTFLKISEIAGGDSTEYGEDHPSSGAVTASLESSKFDVAGIQADSQNGIKGAVKVA